MASELPGVRLAAALVAACLVAVSAAACSTGRSSRDPATAAAPPDGPPTVTADGASCRLSTDTVTVGDVVLEVRSTAASAVTVQLVGNPPGRVRAQVLNLAPGAGSRLQISLPAGDYTVRCTVGGATSTAALSVDGEGGPG